jgi:hypothetical protein
MSRLLSLHRPFETRCEPAGYGGKITNQHDVDRATLAGFEKPLGVPTSELPMPGE